MKKKLEENKEKALISKKYHKSNRVHLGIEVPKLSAIAKEISKNLNEAKILKLTIGLWRSNIFDGMILAIKLLQLKKVKPSKRLFELIEDLLRDVDGWCLEDQLAIVAYKCLKKDPTILDKIEKWTLHDNFWMRREALVFTLPLAKKGQDPTRVLGWAQMYVKDREWFIQKAIGWWLRILAPHSPQKVMEFVSENFTDLTYVAKKEALRKLPS